MGCRHSTHLTTPTACECVRVSVYDCAHVYMYVCVCGGGGRLVAHGLMNIHGTSQAREHTYTACLSGVTPSSVQSARPAPVASAARERASPARPRARVTAAPFPHQRAPPSSGRCQLRLRLRCKGVILPPVQFGTAPWTTLNQCGTRKGEV